MLPLAPYTKPPTHLHPLMHTLGKGEPRGVAWHTGVPCVDRRGCWHLSLQESGCSALGLHPTPMSGSLPLPQRVRWHCTWPTPGAVAGRLGAVLGTSRREVGHSQCTLQFERHCTEIPQHQGKGNGAARKGEGLVTWDVWRQHGQHPRLGGKQWNGWGLMVGTCPG